MPKKGKRGLEPRPKPTKRETKGHESEIRESSIAYEEDARAWIEELYPPLEQSGAALETADPIRLLRSTLAGERILKILISIFPTESALLGWVNHPHPDLGGKTPLQVVELGYPGAVEGMLEGALIGLPS
jgi:hypothetical protein